MSSWVPDSKIPYDCPTNRNRNSPCSVIASGVADVKNHYNFVLPQGYFK